MLVKYEDKCTTSVPHMVDLLYEAVLACPKDVSLRLHLAKLEERRSGLAAARAVLKPVGAAPDDNILRAMAKLETDARDHEKARAYYRQAADAEALQSGNSSPYNTSAPVSPPKRKPTRKGKTVKSLHAWALMEARLGNLTAAREILEEAKAITEHDSAIWRAIGELEGRDRNFEKARTAFQNAIAIDPHDARLFLAWGKIEALAGDLDRAEMLIDRVANAGPKGTAPTLAPSQTQKMMPSGGGTSASRATANPKPSRFQNNINNNTNVALTPHLLADALRERAILAARNGQLDDSVTLLTRASQIEPDCATGWRLLASQQLRVKGIVSAREVYRTGLQRVAQSAKPKLLHWWGQDERSAGDIDAARERFRLATCANSDYMSAWMSWGLLEKSEGNIAEACDIFEQASKRAERDLVRSPFIFQAWGRVEELERGRAEYASQIFRRGTNLVPTSGPLWSAWGLLEERRGNIEKARELFAKSSTTDPTHGSAWHSWALLEARRCNYERASELFKKGNENDASNASLLASWAMMENKELGNISRSRDLFERAVTADPYFAPAWHAWGCLEMTAGSLEKAQQLFQKAIEVRPDDPSPWHTLGVLESEHRHDHKAAIKHWKRAIEVEPGHALSYQAWALLEGNKNGNLEEARRLFEYAMQEAKLKQADMAMLLQSWASLEEQHGEFDQARKLLRKGLEVDRRRAETWQSLALVEKARGNREVAKRLLADGVESTSPLSGAATLYVIWAKMEAEEGNIGEARDLFAAGVRVNPSNVKTWNAYAAAENKYGDASRAAEIKSTCGALFVRQDNANEDFKL
ncbi:TPR repeat-containing protein [Chondrus crispus]|uniref:TPR repeat-containing protein n=1 Tax=Chondrus crispus TaxID=2769 RepID=R7QNZ1_CHOCR|nr:TPR repeat-containing protein [Chondrus crispus]CDF39100.1 TPR repeat-containing protein [Chondrus crispus]|eukprot:XP_005719011.1 TPR repeat-containing protein [Chondrus crispus]